MSEQSTNAASRPWRVLAINPGSTSTKVGLFDGDTKLFSVNVAHPSDKLATFEGISDQMDYRKQTILSALAENNVDLATIDAFVGRGGGLLSCPGGTYVVDDVVLGDARVGKNGIQHPAQLGSQLAHEFAVEAASAAGESDPRPAFIVNPPDTDELCDLARMTGIKGVYRQSHLHALNLKETAIRHAQSMGRSYEECNFVVCHIGGGISVSAHQAGRMVDGNDIVRGDGSMAPTRCGSVPVAQLLDYLETHTVAETRKLCTKAGGFVDLLGTSDALEVSKRAQAGDAAAKRAWDGMIYQICKLIGEMACVLEGQVDGILLGGGMVYNEDLVAQITRRCGWIAPVSAYPGEFELEAMASGACRVLSGQEEPLHYSGKKVFDGFTD